MMLQRQVEEESDELFVCGLVTRYGPRTSCQRERINESK